MYYRDHQRLADLGLSEMEVQNDGSSTPYFLLNLSSQFSLVNIFLKFCLNLNTLSVISTSYFSVLTDKIIGYKNT